MKQYLAEETEEMKAFRLKMLLTGNRKKFENAVHYAYKQYKDEDGLLEDFIEMEKEELQKLTEGHLDTTIHESPKEAIHAIIEQKIKEKLDNPNKEETEEKEEGEVD